MSYLVIFTSSGTYTQTNIVDAGYPYLSREKAIAKAIELNCSPNNYYTNSITNERVYRGNYYAVEMKIVYSVVNQVHYE